MSTPAATTKTAELRLAHSPDSDDAFMFYALATGKVRLPGVKFTHILSDIESLNQAAQHGDLRHHRRQLLRLRVRRR